jgi:Fe-S-cluster containining protein
VRPERRRRPAQVRWSVPGEIAAADEHLVLAYDEVIGEGERRAARHLACRVGCTACCIGPFDITVLDAARLTRGLARLASEVPSAARALRRRASEQWRSMVSGFPGDARTGVLAADEEARQTFFERFASAPCAVLDPSTGACSLYAWRPLSCRSFGLPVRLGGQTLPPCVLNFTEATAAEIEAATVEPDANDLEGGLLARCTAGDTVICAVLGGAAAPVTSR